MKKVKVTKRIAKKVPWYERPPLLFGVIAAVLLVGGILMAQVQSRNAGQTALGSAADSVAAVADSVAAVSAAQARLDALARVDAPLPSVEPGECMCPIFAETRPEAARARELLRQAHGVVPVGSEEVISAGTCGFAEISDLQTSTTTPVVWTQLQVSPQGSSHLLEIHCDRDGYTYVMGFVPVEVAAALAKRGSALELPDVPAGDEVPKWKFWHKKPKDEELLLYAGSEITLYPNVLPEATCAIALPSEHIATGQMREIRIPGARPLRALQVTLR